MKTWGIIGGSGLDLWEEIDWIDEISVSTPYGEPSAPLRVGSVAEKGGVCHRLIYLPRHGVDHAYAPHQINYRANLWAMKRAGVKAVLATATVGAIASDMAPGSICLPDQLIDYTWGREQSFSEEGKVLHIDFTKPFDTLLRRTLERAAKAVLDPGDLHINGVYGCTQGPRLETAAEIARLAKDGCTLVGMTAMPEAALARELALPYALLCLTVNPAAGLGESAAAIDHQALQQVMAKGMRAVKAVLLKTMIEGA